VERAAGDACANVGGTGGAEKEVERAAGDACANEEAQAEPKKKQPANPEQRWPGTPPAKEVKEKKKKIHRSTWWLLL
jgi:hypothetical protein